MLKRSIIELEYNIDELIFEWDEKKNRINIIKHGLSFKTAALVFTDPDYIDIYDQKHSTVDEERHLIIGLVGSVIIVVCIFYEKSTRIISARTATKAEEEIYYER